LMAENGSSAIASLNPVRGPVLGLGEATPPSSVSLEREVLERSNKTVSTSGFFFTGDRGFESFSLHRRVSCELNFLDHG
jgi:hypothetical protein